MHFPVLRISWEAVAKIVTDVVAESVGETRPREPPPHRGRRGLLSQGAPVLDAVADHDHKGAVVWVGEGKDHRVLEAFYDELGDEGRASRMHQHRHGRGLQVGDGRQGPHLATVRGPVPSGQAGKRRPRSDQARRLNQFRALEHPRAPWWKHTRRALLEDEADLSENQLEVLHQLRRRSSSLYRGWQLKEVVRAPTGCAGQRTRLSTSTAGSAGPSAVRSPPS